MGKWKKSNERTTKLFETKQDEIIQLGFTDLKRTTTPPAYLSGLIDFVGREQARQVQGAPGHAPSPIPTSESRTCVARLNMGEGDLFSFQNLFKHFQTRLLCPVKTMLQNGGKMLLQHKVAVDLRWVSCTTFHAATRSSPLPPTFYFRLLTRSNQSLKFG